MLLSFHLNFIILGRIDQKMLIVIFISLPWITNWWQWHKLPYICADDILDSGYLKLFNILRWWHMRDYNWYGFYAWLNMNLCVTEYEQNKKWFNAGRFTCLAVLVWILRFVGVFFFIVWMPSKKHFLFYFVTMKCEFLIDVLVILLWINYYIFHFTWNFQFVLFQSMIDSCYYVYD